MSRKITLKIEIIDENMEKLKRLPLALKETVFKLQNDDITRIYNDSLSKIIDVAIAEFREFLNDCEIDANQQKEIKNVF